MKASSPQGAIIRILRNLRSSLSEAPKLKLVMSSTMLVSAEVQNGPTLLSKFNNILTLLKQSGTLPLQCGAGSDLAMFQLFLRARAQTLFGDKAIKRAFKARSLERD